MSRWPPTSISNQPDDKIPLRSAASLTNIEKTLPQFTVIDSDGEEHSSFQPLMVDAAQMRLAQNLNAPPALNHAARLDQNWPQPITNLISQCLGILENIGIMFFELLTP